MSNLFGEIPAGTEGEFVQELFHSGPCRVERIVSRGQASPLGFWYDQEENEWVAVLAGKAGLLFEGEAGPRELGPGDWVFIPAGTRHRVEWTDPRADTVWLAVFSRTRSGAVKHSTDTGGKEHE